ncbi:MAG TPA: hypothetical protein VE956_02085 [Nodularia sp. (in: cyanobacteria)]|nr:hypothetical protein [Nodularia sp. (in: cyanobacteria)]
MPNERAKHNLTLISIRLRMLQADPEFQRVASGVNFQPTNTIQDAIEAVDEIFAAIVWADYEDYHVAKEQQAKVNK